MIGALVFVMAGLDPAIHEDSQPARRSFVVDLRVKPGDDGLWWSKAFRTSGFCMDRHSV
jgi:hypothetical protein